jgi:bacterioferritin
MQLIVNELSGSAFVHKMQGQLFKSQGFDKLGQKYIDHYTEEMEWVEKFTDRMLDLGCVPQVKVCNETTLISDAVEYINADMKLQREGVEALYKMMPTLANDPTTYDIMKAYLADEEEDLYWDEEQVELISLIGKQNWLIKQM